LANLFKKRYIQKTKIGIFSIIKEWTKNCVIKYVKIEDVCDNKKYEN